MANTKAGPELVEGDAVAVVLSSTTYSGHVERRFIGPWPEKREALFICLPGRFPYRISELEDYGATIARGAVGAITEKPDEAS